MNASPLIRTKWSNERLMTALLLVLALYLLPRFLADSVEAGKVLVLLVFALGLDTIAHFIRFKRPVCAVSAAVTALVFHALSPGVPLWMELVALAAALLIGKHVFGGMGKNPINPAMVGILISGFFFPVNLPVFEPTLLLLPAILLSLPFLLFRPFAGLGMGLGMSAALLLHHNLTPAGLLGYGVALWAALVMTDPVTTTARPVAGGIIGVVAGFIPVFFGTSVSGIAFWVLVSNIVSFSVNSKSMDTGRKIHKIPLSFRHRRIPFLPGNTVFHDLTGETPKAASSDKAVRDDFTPEEILERIERNKVFGFGGAAFPSEKKIRTAMESAALQKHLIVNGVECDPGLIHDKWLLRHKARESMKGIQLLRRCIPFNDVTIAAKDLSGIHGYISNAFPLRLHKVPDHYPAGAEKLLIREVLGKKLGDGEIPAMAGILVLNVQTVIAIYEAVCLDQRADTRFITLADLDKRSGSIAHVRLGAKIHDVADRIHSGSINVYTGGGMMNASLSRDEAVVDENVNFLAVGKVEGYREALCSQCCFCSAVCPAQLNVNKIVHLVDAGRMNQAMRLHPERCLNCGGCSVVCLAGRNLSARMSKAKDYCIDREKKP